MKKLFIHDKAKLCSQETNFIDYGKFIPLTRKNLSNYFTFTKSIKESDYIFLGQITEGTSTCQEFVDICNQYPEKTIVDIEGDFGTSLFHPCFKEVISCAGGPDKSWGLKKCFVRPQLSKVFKTLHESNYVPIESKNKLNNFFFQGQINVTNRVLMIRCLQNLNFKNVFIKFMNGWNGNTNIESTDYVKNLDSNLISLCPKGVGGSSIRFYESCLMGCAPVILGNDKVMYEDEYDTSFILRLTDYNNMESLTTFLNEVEKISKEEMIERGQLARNYYLNRIKPHLDDPIKTFYDWLIKI